MALDVVSVRKDFPILKTRVNGHRVAYLDSAATSQKPIQVIRAVSDFYGRRNAGVHRSVHYLGERATEAFESAREKVGRFINASAQEIVFTRNATEAINLVRYAYALPTLKKGEKIVSTIMEHHSNFVPWQQLAERGAEIVFIDITDEGLLDYGALEKTLGKGGVKLVAVCHASNTLGTINDVKKVCRLAHRAGALCLVDAAQSVPHLPVDVREMGCDFLAFSGHKMLGPTGSGVLYAKSPLLSQMEPFLFGGDMIRSVSVGKTEWNEPPWKFEAGTPDVAGAVGLGAAVDYLTALGMREVREHEKRLTAYALESLSCIKGVEIYGPAGVQERCGLVSFNVGDIHPHDLATILDGEGVEIRSGHNCTEPLIRRLGTTLGAVARASFYVYNTEQEVDRLCEGIRKAKKVFKLK